ncbi:hypothetical protein M378DRAFT_17877 [Amanita muscaria Koide BX008]|uniref:HAT C-terminal dimerisation domain-containing protein n=1 Tax=Amanita muscaria (strain Koide BX008) TaxID=946122 RepID=A0A0C2RYU8_AMAMK|nr:hypothetical protein M378DRAFT_17877 [Amanita muscaria Koide BX008]
MSITAGCQKIDGYYEKTTDTPAYILSMVLDPRQKLGHFKKNWLLDLQGDVVKCVEDLFKERYTKLQGETAALHPPATVKTKLGILLRELSDDEEDTDINNADTRDLALEDPNCPWSREFHIYLDTPVETIPEGWTMIAWWGMNVHHYPVWASLAHDYLAMMASSVSSERAFSQGGITISKWHNRLKGDVVEALQSLKCAIRTNLIFREPGPSTISEGYEEDDGENDSEDEEGWDSLVIDAEAEDADNDAEDADNDD